MPDLVFIWISRWDEFQHYAPRRDSAPPWIKTYTKQLDDGEYLNLSWVQRGVLHDLRIAFARSRGKLSRDTRQLSHRFGERVTSVQLDSLNHAGFIEFVSRQTLDNRLELLYASRAPAPSQEGEVDRELKLKPSVVRGEAEDARHVRAVVEQMFPPANRLNWTDEEPPLDILEPHFDHADTDAA